MIAEGPEIRIEQAGGLFGGTAVYELCGGQVVGHDARGRALRGPGLSYGQTAELVLLAAAAGTVRQEQIVPGAETSDTMSTTLRITTRAGTHTLVWHSGDTVPDTLTALVARMVELAEPEVASPGVA